MGGTHEQKEDGKTMAVRIEDFDQGKLEELQGKVIGDVAGSVGLLLAYMGISWILYGALAEIGPATSQKLAGHTGLAERYVREWLSANAAGGYIEYDPAAHSFSMTPEQALVFPARASPPACRASSRRSSRTMPTSRKPPRPFAPARAAPGAITAHACSAAPTASSRCTRRT